MMIEKIVLDYLNNALEYPTYTQEQNNGEKYFYLIQKVGSSVDNKIDTSMVAVQSYAPSRYEAAEMNYAMIEAMDDIVALDAIGKCKRTVTMTTPIHLKSNIGIRRCLKSYIIEEI